MDLLNNPLLVVLAGIAIVALIFWYVATEIDRRKRNVGTLAAALVIALCVIAVSPPEEKLKGGIDLVGGSSFTVEIQPAMEDDQKTPIPVGEDAINSVKETLSNRLAEGRTDGVQMYALGKDRLVIEMPGVDGKEAARVESIIERTAFLECKAVHPQNDQLASQVESGQTLVPAGWKLYKLPITDEDGNKTGIERPILLARRNIVTGDLVQRAMLTPGKSSQVIVRLTQDGGDRLFNATKQMRARVDRMAVVLDGRALIAPTVQTSLSRDFNITGLDGPQEAKEVVAALSNPLKNPLLILSKNEVTAKYGKEVIRQGVTAALAGLLITAIFVLLYYRFAGLIALFGLVINMLILFGSMAMFKATFSLAGIAGIILTIGIAVDANVLIYERLREEMANGKSVGAAIKAAYEKAFTAIFDANITTILTALILLWMGSDQIKGFAITLTIGILASMFAALVGTRILFFWGTDSGILRKLSFMNLIPERTIKFMNKRKPAFMLSAVLVIGSLVSSGIHKGDALGIDFVGGSILTIQVDKTDTIETTEIDAILTPMTLEKNHYAQKESITGGDSDILKIKVDTKDVDKVEVALRKNIPLLAKKNAAGDYVTKISPAIIQATLGKEFLINSLWALGVGLFAVLFYISLRFEFSFAVGAFVALFHDLIISIGAVLLIGTELSMIHVGAFLTIAGYSINDTIVVFDRIREMLRMKRGNVKDIMDLAINATLSRTILTSATTFMAVLVLYIFGGAALKDFSFAIMIGVIIGTYSSIFIAAPVVYLWSKARGSNLRRELLDANLEAEVTPSEA
ncbi:protein translocase subunit SecD [Akkermansiaceae bacterium]|nr:protein translocase subunit SecD [Akkermansiaceae bacterium]